MLIHQMDTAQGNVFGNKIMRYNLGNYNVPVEAFGGVLVDIGANNGCFTRKYANNFSIINAYEPNPSLAEQLKNEFSNQKIITIFNEIVWNSDGEKKVLANFIANDEDGSCGVVKDYNQHLWNEDKKLAEITTVSFKTVLGRAGGKIDFLKMDCESSEYEILLGQDLTSIRYIGIELHDHLGRDKYEELFKFIEQTHLAEAPCNFSPGSHQELLFTRK